MTKVRVLKAMPFAKAGEVKEVNPDGSVMLIPDVFPTSPHSIKNMIDNGWLEYIKEPKMLEEKFGEYLDKAHEYKDIPRTTLAQIAITHFKEIFDKTRIDWNNNKMSGNFRDCLRKAMFGEEES